MGWQVDLLEATSDNVVTQQEVTSIVASTVNAAAIGIVAVGMMSMAVGVFYDILGTKKLAGQEGEVLGMVKKIW